MPVSSHDSPSPEPSPSKNDIFSTSWRVLPPPSLYDGPDQSGPDKIDLLRRSKTLDSGRPRAVKGADFEPHTAKELRRVSDFVPAHHKVVSLDHVDTVVPPPKLTNRTSSFFDQYSPTHPPALDPQSSARSTISTASSDSPYTQSSNPSLLASLPSSPVTSAPLADVDLRLFATREYFLGSGRFSKVFLAAYKYRHEGDDGWKMCAVKRMEKDPESQALGMREVWFLCTTSSGNGEETVASSTSVASKVGDERAEDQVQHTDHAGHPGKQYLVRLLSTKDTQSVVASTTGTPTVTLTPPSHTPPSLTLQIPSSPYKKLSHSRSSSDQTSDLLHHALENSVRQHAATLPLSPPSTVESLAPPRPSRLLLILPYLPFNLAAIIHSKPHLLTPSLHARICYQLCLAISYVHSLGILHTDIKPQNVLLTDALDVRLGDFNTALHLPSLTSVSGSSTLTDPIGLGTTSYSPLEFVRRSPSPFGLPADVFSTGVTLMVALVGREPFERIVGARGKTRADLMVWVGRGGYWAWEERERMSAGEDTMASAEDGQNGDSEEDEPSGVAPGPQQVETLLGKPCPAELRTTIVSSRSMRGCRKGIDETAQALDRHRYPDGSPALYYLGRGDDGRQVRVPDEAVMLLKRMCLPAAEERPLIDEAVAIFENVFKATCN